MLTPTKLYAPFVVAPAPVIVIWSALLKLGDITLWRTVSATKSAAYPVKALASWYTDFTSYIPKVLTVFIDLTKEVFSFMISCSPAMNWPVTSLK